MGWILRVIDSFSAAHFLREYQGACENLHGHNWRVELEVVGDELDETGLLVDFKRLKAVLKEVLDVLDHRLLNEIPPFDRVNPSSENIARFIFCEAGKRLPESVKVKSVAVWESDRACAVYFED
ncbi:MAG: 6-carboxytetrahydropterin synthase QueD [Deferribacteres bacterium]|nr:6-carboxytetrahydropterin synthase QueD [Deferribacteres bacterium]